MHIHSDFSHDGHDGVAEIARRAGELGLDFCMLTDHFEDFDEEGFARYLAAVDVANRTGSCLVIPGVEVDIDGLHVLLLQVTDYEEVNRVLVKRKLGDSQLVALLAHPNKYTPAEISRFVTTCDIAGIEVWNQAFDGLRLPDGRGLRERLGNFPAEGCGVFFGLDTHDIRRPISNVILMPPEMEAPTAKGVVE
ncbi:MAG: PHP domain-containing protein, partial [Armatimonadota bacterium]